MLVALAVLTPIAVVTPQDQSRFCLSQALLHGRLSNDGCLSLSFDKASYGGHLYTDKAPGVSALALPSVALLQLGSPERWSNDDLSLWGVRVLTIGVLLLVCAFMVGRVSEGLSPGYGAVALVTFALGTLVAPFGVVAYEDVPAAAFAFLAFLLAWRGRPGLAGLVGGAALLVEYQSGLILLVLGCYLAAQGLRPLRAFIAGVVPGVVLLGAYDWEAFGEPWHLSYRYVANSFAAEQTTGFFGIGLPRTFGAIEVLAGSRGLLVVSPVLILAAFGLVRLGRNHLAEAIVAGCVTAIFVVINFGYFDPYGGSQGPRFLVIALPFLCLGLGPAFSWRPRLTVLLACLSVIPMTLLTLIWSKVYAPGVENGPSGGVLGELVRLPAELGSSRLSAKLSPNALSAFGPGPAWGALLVASCAAAALLIALCSMPWTDIRAERRESKYRRPSKRMILIPLLSAYLILVADVLALTNYPYGSNPQVRLVSLHTSISTPTNASYLGGEVNFVITVIDRGTVGAGHLTLTVKLSPGMRLVGPPALTRGPGCTGTSTLVCNIGFLRPRGKQEATASLGIQITQPHDQQLTAQSSAQGDPQSNLASFVVSVN